jgi:hypothetical protein
MNISENSVPDKPPPALRGRLPNRRPEPFPAFAAPLVRIVACPIAHGWRYQVIPAGRAQLVSYCLDQARATAARYSRKIIEEGPPAAFHRRAAR